MDEWITDGLKKAGLQAYFSSLPPSHQKEYLEWVMGAKKQGTRQARLAKMIEMLTSKQR